MDHHDLIGLVKLCGLKRAALERPPETVDGRWSWAPGIIFMPEFPCPFNCGAQLIATGVWKVESLSYKGGFLIAHEEAAVLSYSNATRHPHTSGSGICMGNAKNIQEWFPGICVRKSYSGGSATAYFVYRSTGHWCESKPIGWLDTMLTSLWQWSGYYRHAFTKERDGELLKAIAVESKRQAKLATQCEQARLEREAAQEAIED